jgi:hypothetical protein
MLDHALTIRAATPGDADALRWLAALDSRPRISGYVLLAERDGVAVAAIALASGAVVADPFNSTAAAVRFLRARRYRLLRQGGDVGAVRALVRRLAPQPLRA